MDFGGKQPSSSDIESSIAAAKQQIEMQLITARLQKITDKCFQKCIAKPGSSLDSYQQKCLAFCMDRYGETEKLVSQALVARVQAEGGH